jgi:hypothetical protein
MANPHFFWGTRQENDTAIFLPGTRQKKNIVAVVFGALLMPEQCLFGLFNFFRVPGIFLASTFAGYPAKEKIVACSLLRFPNAATVFVFCLFKFSAGYPAYPAKKCD